MTTEQKRSAGKPIEAARKKPLPAECEGGTVEPTFAERVICLECGGCGFVWPQDDWLLRCETCRGYGKV